MEFLKHNSSKVISYYPDTNIESSVKAFSDNNADTLHMLLSQNWFV